ncbi:MAG: hypothetical protein JNM63_06825, partial [Spirochaetia bacterium]|nr:hypothetical protein [Spirochaetia bacterium]
MKELPFWIFHGEIDKTVSPERSEEMAFALLEQKARVKLTTYPDLGHNCWDATYADPALYRWFLRFTRGGGEKPFVLQPADEKTFKKWEGRSSNAVQPARTEQLARPAEWIRQYSFSKTGDEARVILSNLPAAYATSRSNPGPGEITETTVWRIPPGSPWTVTPLRSEIKIPEKKSARVEFQVGWSGDSNRIFPIPDRIVTISSGGKIIRTNQFALSADLRDFSVRGNAVKLPAAPLVDGSPNEAEWKGAPIFSLLSLQGGLPKFNTEARVSYDERFFYAAFVCAEPRMAAMVRKETNRDGSVWEDDSVEIFLDTGFSRSHYFHLIANTAGVVLDEKGYDRTWDSKAMVKTGKTGTAWTIEVAIPWSSMNVNPPRKGTQMGLELVRNRMQLEREMT